MCKQTTKWFNQVQGLEKLAHKWRVCLKMPPLKKPNKGHVQKASIKSVLQGLTKEIAIQEWHHFLKLLLVLQE